MKTIKKMLAVVCCLSLAFLMPFSTAAQEDANEEAGAMTASANYTLQQISSRSWAASGINSIELDYNNFGDTIVVAPSTSNQIILTEFNSVNNQQYVASVTQSGSTLKVSQSSSRPSGGYDSEVRLFIPNSWSGKLTIKNKSNVKISNMASSASYEVYGNGGLVTFANMSAGSIKVDCPHPGQLTMRSVTAAVDLKVIGSITINGDNVLSGTIKGSDGTRASDIIVNCKSLSGNLTIDNARGKVDVGFPANASFKVNATAQPIYNNYPYGSFQTSNGTLTGSSGSNPTYTVKVTTGTFRLNEVR